MITRMVRKGPSKGAKRLRWVVAISVVIVLGDNPHIRQKAEAVLEWILLF